MLNRNCSTTLEPECFRLEKAFGVIVGPNGNSMKIYAISRSKGHLNFIANWERTIMKTHPNSKIVAITDSFVFIDKQA